MRDEGRSCRTIARTLGYSLTAIIYMDILPEAAEYHTGEWRGYEGIFEGRGRYIVHKKSKRHVNLNGGLRSRLRQYSGFLRRKTLAYAKMLSSFIVELFALFWGEGWVLTPLPYRIPDSTSNYIIVLVCQHTEFLATLEYIIAIRG